MSEAHTLLLEMEKAAEELGIEVSTLGRLAGQGGRFYDRVKSGKRFWPETAEKVRVTIAELRDERGAA